MIPNAFVLLSSSIYRFFKMLGTFSVRPKKLIASVLLWAAKYAQSACSVSFPSL
nr:MAG TPA: hypothetical protein [Caudoviricetes sp.]DAU53376.1 MAG TPA: hypothetical protein [Caudoviricetes sp.]